ncbi:MAG: methionyl-tRNA formyltransferase [Gammaproteobacteria bacterium]|nr:methionyl-tRNA formyltransferase [Gammaproteobacteria bacterium]
MRALDPLLNIAFAGTPEFAATVLQALLDDKQQVCAVYTQPDRPAGRGRKLTPSAVKLLAQLHGLPVLQPSSLKNAEVQQNLRALQPDLLVVVAYGLILPRAVLEIPHLGCVNVHASLLPRWRGAAPIQRAILAGDSETGVTLMQMDEGLDTGPMLARRACPILPDDNAQTLHDRLATLGGALLVQSLPALAQGTLSATPQDDARATYAHKIEKREAQLNWRESALQLERCVRAFNPWPVAHTTWRGEMLRIWAAETLMPTHMDVLVSREAGSRERQNTHTTPGSVLATAKQGIDVAAGHGILRITRLQLPGGRPLSAEEFLNAHSLLDAQLGAQ